MALTCSASSLRSSLGFTFGNLCTDQLALCLGMLGLLEVLLDQIQVAPQQSWDTAGSPIARQIPSPAYSRSLTASLPMLHLSKSKLLLSSSHQHPHLQWSFTLFSQFYWAGPPCTTPSLVTSTLMSCAPSFSQALPLCPDHLSLVHCSQC